MSKVLVTGGLGFIGSNLVDKLIEYDHEVWVVDNLKSISSNIKYKNSKVIEYRIEDAADLKYTISLPKNLDVIFHLAADARIQPSFQDPVGTLQNNVQTTAEVCEFARKKEAKVVLAGSSSIYGGEVKNPYTFSKWQAEQVCNMYLKVFDLDTVTARFFNVYGFREPIKGDYATVVGKFIRQYNEGETITIVGDGEQRRDFTNVNDIVSGLIKLGFSNYQGVYNLGSGQNYSINDLVDMIKKYSSKEVKVGRLNPRPGEAQETLADIKKTYIDLGWEPVHNLEDYIKEKLNGKN